MLPSYIVEDIKHFQVGKVYCSIIFLYLGIQISYWFALPLPISAHVDKNILDLENFFSLRDQFPNISVITKKSASFGENSVDSKIFNSWVVLIKYLIEKLYNFIFWTILFTFCLEKIFPYPQRFREIWVWKNKTHISTNFQTK